MPEAAQRPSVTARLWLDLTATAIIISYAYVFSEWLFFATKPSFMSTLALSEKIWIAPLASVPWVMISIGLILAAWVFSHLWSGRGWKWLLLGAGCLVPAVTSAILGFLLFDNFTQTLLGISSLAARGKLRLIPVFLFVVLLWFSFYWLVGLTRRWAGSGAAGRLRAGSWRIALALTLVTTSVLTLIWEVPGNWSNGMRVADGGVSRRPNIIFIGGDGLNAENLDLYGYQRATAPRLKEFSEDAIVFENAFSNAAHTGSSITSMLAGRLPTSTRLIYPPNVLQGKDAYEHMPGLLRQLGYQTAVVSVRYFADPYDLNMRHGFHFANGRRSGQIPARAASWIGWSAAYFIEVMADRVKSRALVLMGYETMTDAYEEVTRPTLAKKSRDEARVDMFLSHLSSLSEPFFSQIHLLGTHGPRFRPSQPVFSRGLEQTEDWQNDFYDDAITDFDRHFARIMAFLEGRDLIERSIIVVYSDHGSSFRTYRRIPLLIRLPGVPAGRVSRNVQNLDIAPTILQYLGLEIPAWMQGYSLISPESPADRLTFSARLNPYLATRNEQGRVGLDASRLEPPFFGLGGVAMVDCNRWYEVSLESWGVKARLVEGHTDPCDEELDPLWGRRRILEHLVATGYIESPQAHLGPLFKGFSAVHLAQIVQWGPQSTMQGGGFNVQEDGSSAFWMRVEGPAQDLEVYLGEEPLPTRTRPQLITARLAPELTREYLAKPRSIPISLVNRERRLMQFVGNLVVRRESEDPLDDAADLVPFDSQQLKDGFLCEIDDWGPQSATVDLVPQIRGFWVKFGGEATGLSVLLETQELDTFVAADEITATISDPEFLARPGTYRIYLANRRRGIKQQVGVFEVVSELDVAGFAEGRILTATEWGPPSVLQGLDFNRQPGGESAFWIRVRGESWEIKLLLDDRPLETVVEPGLITAKVKDAKGLEPGIHRLAVASSFKKIKQEVGQFLVKPRLEVEPSGLPDSELCEVSDWGPQSVASGRPFNARPDGTSVFWFSLGSESCPAEVFLDNIQLDTLAAPNIVTAHVPAQLDRLHVAGPATLYLVDLEGRQKQVVGDLQIRRKWWPW